MKLGKMMLCVSLIAVPFIADAGNLTIVNRTKFDLSFKVNNICSDDFGMIPANKMKIIAEKDFNKACESNPSICSAIVYSAPNCNGENVGEVGFNISNGVSYISGQTSRQKISILGEGFNLIFMSPIRK